MHIEFGTGHTTALQSLASPAVIGVVTALLGPVGGVTAATGAKLDGSLRTAIAKAAGSATGAAVSDERLRDRLATAVRESMERAFRRVGADPNLIPSDQTMFEDLLWAFGAWQSLEDMNAAMDTRVYATGPDGRVGFKLVK